MFAKHLAYHAFEKRSILPFDKKNERSGCVGEEEEQMLPRFSVGVFRLCRRHVGGSLEAVRDDGSFLETLSIITSGRISMKVNMRHLNARRPCLQGLLLASFFARSLA